MDPRFAFTSVASLALSLAIIAPGSTAHAGGPECEFIPDTVSGTVSSEAFAAVLADPQEPDIIEFFDPLLIELTTDFNNFTGDPVVTVFLTVGGETYSLTTVEFPINMNSVSNVPTAALWGFGLLIGNTLIEDGDPDFLAIFPSGEDWFAAYLNAETYPLSFGYSSADSQSPSTEVCSFTIEFTVEEQGSWNPDWDWYSSRAEAQEPQSLPSTR